MSCLNSSNISCSASIALPKHNPMRVLQIIAVKSGIVAYNLRVVDYAFATFR